MSSINNLPEFPSRRIPEPAPIKKAIEQALGNNKEETTPVARNRGEENLLSWLEVDEQLLLSTRNIKIVTPTANTPSAEAAASNDNNGKSGGTGSSNFSDNELWQALKSQMLSMGVKEFHTYVYGTSATSDFDKEYFLQFEKSIKEFIMSAFGFEEDFAKIITDFIIDKSISDGYQKNQTQPADFAEDDTAQVSGTWNSKDVFNNIINFIENMDFVTNPDMEFCNNTSGRIKIKSGEGLKYTLSSFSDDPDSSMYMSSSYTLFLQIFQETAKSQNIDMTYLGNAVFDKLCETLGLDKNKTSDFTFEQLSSLDKEGNGWLDDWMKIVNSSVIDAKNIQHSAIEEKINKLNKEPSSRNLEELIKILSSSVGFDKNSIKYEYDDKGYTESFSFRYNNTDYEITFRVDFPPKDTRTTDDVTDS